MNMYVKVAGGFVAGAAAIYLAGGVGLLGASSFWFSKEKLYTVKLIPQGVSGTLNVNLEKGKKCSKGFEGCMAFAEDKVGFIRFYLPGSKKVERTCAGASKVITRIELSTTENGAVADGEKGDFAGGVDPWLKQDAFPTVNQADGVIYDADIATGLSRVHLTNLNSHDAAFGIKPFWYQVTVTNCTDATKKWVTDPRGDNTGLK